MSTIDLAPPPAPTMLGAAPELDRVLDFLRTTGLRVTAGPVPDDSFVPAMTVRDGVVVYDPRKAGWVGDLLHEGGHLAVTDPAIRASLPEIRHDPGEEMATIAWSYAAAMAVGLPAATLFHPAYKGGPDYLIEAFSRGAYIGLPMLRYWGMAARPDEDHPPYPAMRRWLRPSDPH